MLPAARIHIMKGNLCQHIANAVIAFEILAGRIASADVGMQAEEEVFLEIILGVGAINTDTFNKKLLRCL